MLPTEVLKHEHELILKVINAAEIEIKNVFDNKKFEIEKFENMVDFFRNFADFCHHAKEEKQLFPKMVEKGMSYDSGPIAVMINDHNQGRELIRNVINAFPKAKEGDAIGIYEVVQNMNLFCQLLKHHIFKENNILFPMADKLFSDKENEMINELFEEVEKNDVGEGVHEKYHKLAEDIIN